MIGGRTFADVQELKRLLKSIAARKFARTLTENMLTYGLGRGLEGADYCTVEAIGGSLAAERLPDPHYPLRNRRESGVSESGRFPMSVIPTPRVLPGES